MVIEVTFDVTDVYISTTVSPVYVNVSFEAPSGGGGTEWGDITGTLSDQIDLQTALDGKVPYTGATTNVNLGEYEIKAGQVTLDTSPTGTAAVGTTRWNDTLGSSETTLKGGNVILKNGVDLVARVVNKVSPNTTLTKAAYQAVRVSGAQGQRLAVAFAQANNDNNSADTIGLVIETIATNQEGFIMTVGQIEGINTTGSLQGETWADGDVLYLSPTTAGALTNVKPTGATGHIVVIGYVEYAHVNNGKIYVKVANGWELDELHNLNIVSPTNNQSIFYNSSNQLWENKSIATALGYTPANSATTLTINGVTYDLSANRSWTVSGGISGSGASGQVAYWTGTSSLTGNSAYTFNGTNLFLGGSSSSGNEFQIQSGIFITRLINAGNASNFTFLTSGHTGNLSRYFSLTGTSAVTTFATGSDGGGDFLFSPTGTARMRLYASTGNLLLQNGGTFTDSGERLQVTGTMKVTGNITSNGSFTSSVTGATGSFIAYNPGPNYPRAQFEIGNTSSDINVGLIVAPSTSSPTLQKQSALTISTNRDTLNASSYQIGVYVNTTTAVIYTANRDLSSGAGAGVPLSFQPSGSEAMRLTATSGNLLIGTSTDVASSILTLASTTKGFLPPRMTTTQKNAISTPAAGLVVYDTTLAKLCVYTTAWETITSA